MNKPQLHAFVGNVADVYAYGNFIPLVLSWSNFPPRRHSEKIKNKPVFGGKEATAILLEPSG